MADRVRVVGSEKLIGNIHYAVAVAVLPFKPSFMTGTQQLPGSLIGGVGRQCVGLYDIRGLIGVYDWTYRVRRLTNWQHLLESFL